MVAKSIGERFATPGELAGRLAARSQGADLVRLVRQPDRSTAIAPLPRTSVDLLSDSSTVAVASAAPTEKLSERSWTSAIPWMIVAALFAAALAWPVLSAWMNRDGDVNRPNGASGSEQFIVNGADPAENKSVANPQVDKSLLTVRELDWPRRLDSSVWEIIENGTGLRFLCDGEGLLQFEGAPEDDYRISLEIRRPEWTGHVGAVLGYRESRSPKPGRDFWFESLHVKHVPGDRRKVLACTACPYPRDELGKLTETPLTFAYVPWPVDKPYRLEWEVRQGRLRSVELNGERIPDLTEREFLVRDPDAEWGVQGRIGLYVSRSSGIVRDIVLNGERIRLIAPSPKAR
jgi:hypothetical protein